MQATHSNAIHRYNEPRKHARELAMDALPSNLRHKLILAPVDHKAIAAFRSIQATQARVEDWDWIFASKYCFRYPKAFDLSVWHGSSLCSLSLGRPTYNGKEMRLDFIEKFTNNLLFSGEMFGVSFIAYEAYGKLIDASKLRIMNPTNEKLIKYYSSHGGFSYKKSLKGNPHYLVKSI